MLTTIQYEVKGRSQVMSTPYFDMSRVSVASPVVSHFTVFSDDSISTGLGVPLSEWRSSASGILNTLGPRSALAGFHRVDKDTIHGYTADLSDSGIIYREFYDLSTYDLDNPRPLDYLIHETVLDPRSFPQGLPDYPLISYLYLMP